LGRVGSFAVDRSQFPIVHVHIDGTLADDQWLEFWVQLDTLLTGERYGIVIDLRTAAELSASQRAYVVKNWRENRAQAARVCLMAAVVIKSGLWRGVFTAISWVTPPPHPVVFVSSIAEGDECVRMKLEEAWVPLGPQTQ
jgi:hypothetical protein